MITRRKTDAQAKSKNGSKSIAVTNPATGKVQWEIPSGGLDEVNRAVAAAKEAFPAWSQTPAKERARLLYKLAAAVRERQEELAKLESANVGKPISTARGEVAYVADVFEYYAGAAQRIFGETIPVSAPGWNVTFKVPVGVCGLIVPWNFPIVIASWKLGPSLAAGNTVVLKPASLTPMSALRLGELAAEVGFPEGVLNVITGPGAVVGQALAEHPDVDKISLTGETTTGAGLLQAAAPTMKRVSLELGGKSPCVVFDDADLEKAVAGSAESAFDNTGQDCCARSRVLVQRGIYERFVEGLAEYAKGMRVGDPAQETTRLGPMVSKGQRERVQEYIRVGVEEGANLVCGGKVPEAPALRDGFYLTPAVFADAEPEMRIVREEIFGPVVAVVPFETEEQAVELANDSIYGLSGSVWTRDIGRALRVSKRIRTGNLGVNTPSSVFLEAPFGGFKQSGIGRELGMKALELYTETKNIFLSDQ